ncbi:MAG: PKD domain-containing protein [Crocinitomicaceae bacterium]|nr:PKD domain-containing protein [Crocinitomicaceae bacterium]
MRIFNYIAILIGVCAFILPKELTAQCNINTTTCSTIGNTAGPFTFQNPSNNPSTCLDFINGSSANYAYIVLYITQTGSLDLLIQGNYTGPSCLDVALFDITGQTNPCASLSPSTQLACNYVFPCQGCAEFGTAGLGCPAVVSSPNVTAGSVIMILVEDYSDAQNSFTLTLGSNPGSAQTGLPDPTILPSSLGPFCATDGLMQIQAVNMGGTWSGPGMSATGMFNPQTAGPGVHTINYSIGAPPCNASSSAQITVGSIVVNNMNVGACQNGTYEVTGDITILQPPTSGNLIVEACDGTQTVVASAPFNLGSYPFTVAGLNPNGAACNIHAYFTGSACSQTLNYTAPTCPPGCNITNITATANGCDAGNTYTVSGSVSFNSPPTTGQLIVQDCSGAQQTFNAPFTSPINYSISSLTPNGQACSVTANFTDDPGCTNTKNYTAPSIPVVTASPDVTICPGVSTTLTATGATTYLWDNGAGSASSASVSPSSTTTYTVTGTTTGCTATDQVVVTVAGSITITTSPDVAICSGQSTTISASGASTYSWNNGLGAGGSHSVSPTSTTTYQVTGVDASGCTGQGQLTITVNSNPVITAPNLVVCGGGTGTLTASGAATYTWSPTTNLSSGTGASVTFTAGNSTNYQVTGTDANGCVGFTNVSASVIANPVIEAGSNVNSCFGQQVTLTGSGAGVGGTYAWDNSIANGLPFNPPVGSTVYTVIGTTSDGCTGTDQVTINVEDTPIVDFTATQNQVCAPVVATFTSNSSSGSCIWTFGNGQVVHDCGPITQTFMDAGSYGATLQVTTPNGCSSTLTLPDLVYVEANPIAHFTPSPVNFSIFNPVVNFNNNSSGATSYIWNFGDGGASSEVTPSHKYLDEPGNYLVTLIAISSGGCIDSFQYAVYSNEELIFYIPNTFTPDGDEFNQHFQPIFTSGYDAFDFEMIIFNRWGEKVFETGNDKIGWDGTYGVNGKICEDGTYTWKIEFKTSVNDERKTYVGHVNIIR